MLHHSIGDSHAFLWSLQEKNGTNWNEDKGACLIPFPRVVELHYWLGELGSAEYKSGESLSRFYIRLKVLKSRTDRESAGHEE